MFKNINNYLVFGSSLALYYIFDNKFCRANNKYIDKHIDKNNAINLREIFQIKELILDNNDKRYLHLSTPFNRKIKSIYNLNTYYTDYENYNFNKLSDFFLNIHIFIN